MMSEKGTQQITSAECLFGYYKVMGHCSSTDFVSKTPVGGPFAGLDRN
ncbi:hypothetical protein L248_2540 [Schleiferilactobacillus shenzhenensis LY-73]|uniref:Uncharacterized protein n=1 Tax=Schleiferilactobacillus shenzhenensis LY-73 TaxID=1231336 RepID=U4TVP0_9LACO|nr:hypothetical protein L248_2540 [Schleiferilactobacillus shenzhenensis LY-73]